MILTSRIRLVVTKENNVSVDEHGDRFLKKHVVLTAIISMSIYVAIAMVMRIFTPNDEALAMYTGDDPSLSFLISDAIRVVVILCLSLPLMKHLGTARKSGLHTAHGLSRGLASGSLVVLFCWAAVAFATVDSIKAGLDAGIFTWRDCRFPGIGLFLLTLVTCLLIGIAEETLCRGVIFLNMLDRWGDTRKGVSRSVLLSALPFGLLHLMNFSNSVKAAEAWTIVFQVLYATAFGMFAAVLYLRSGSLWAVIVSHALIDLAQYSRYWFIPSGKLSELDSSGIVTAKDLFQACLFYGLLTAGFLVAAFVMFRKVDRGGSIGRKGRTSGVSLAL